MVLTDLIKIFGIHGINGVPDIHGICGIHDTNGIIDFILIIALMLSLVL